MIFTSPPHTHTERFEHISIASCCSETPIVDGASANHNTYRVVHQGLDASDGAGVHGTLRRGVVHALQELQQGREAVQLHEADDEAVGEGSEGGLQTVDLFRPGLHLFVCVRVRVTLLERDKENVMADLSGDVLAYFGQLFQSFDVVFGGVGLVHGVFSFPGAVDLPFLLRGQVQHGRLVRCSQVEFFLCK